MFEVLFTVVQGVLVTGTCSPFVLRWKVLAELVRGLLSSTMTMVSVLILTGLTSYFYALLIVEYVSKPVLLNGGGGYSDKYTEIVETYFSSLTSTMITLIGFMTVDSVLHIYLTLILENAVLAPIFISLLLIVSVALMNLITAVIVDPIPATQNGVAQGGLLCLEINVSNPGSVSNIFRHLVTVWGMWQTHWDALRNISDPFGRSGETSELCGTVRSR